MNKTFSVDKMHRKFGKIDCDKVGKYTDITEKALNTVQQPLKVDVIDDKSLKKRISKRKMD